MKKSILLLLLLVYPLSLFAASTDISCDDVITTLSSDNSMNWEEFDGNGVRGNYGTDQNKWTPMFDNMGKGY